MSDVPAVSSSSPAQTAEQYLASLLTRSLSIEIHDRRTFLGRFICVDPQCNIILENAYEYLPLPTNALEAEQEEMRNRYWPKSNDYDLSPEELAAERGRSVGMIMISGKDIVSIKIDEGAVDTRDIM
ncbi:N-alpha-acetyltransferase 38, NatC auxiliary subunit, partial [Tremellales sp. Uapishka_1]